VQLIRLLAAVVVSLVLILQDTQPVETRFLLLKVTMPNAALLGLTLLIGMAIGILAALIISGRNHRVGGQAAPFPS
jgi:uncharacterized membrane protein YciS (DUF1049 family)